MPQLISHIDKIAREKARDVLFLTFQDFEDEELDEDACSGLSQETNVSTRSTMIAWLETHGIEWQACGEVANPNCMSSYQGWVYVDVPYDDEEATYRTLLDYLEKPDGSMVYPGVRFCYYTLENAMLNAHHDAPGFWENWAENF